MSWETWNMVELVMVVVGFIYYFVDYGVYWWKERKNKKRGI